MGLLFPRLGRLCTKIREQPVCGLKKRIYEQVGCVARFKYYSYFRFMICMLEVGMKAPDFSGMDQDDKTLSSDFAGKWTVLYFYPKDNTPGCTVQAKDFTEMKDDFVGVGAYVIGVSPDSTESHRSFREKQDLAVNLLSDEEKIVSEAYGVWQKKKNFGKEYMGINRSTFLIDPDGKLAYIWRNVKVDGHADKVLEKVKELQS